METLEFELPEEWAGMAVTVHVQQLDGTLPQPVMLGEDRCLEVDRMFTASEKGLWMLRAMDGNGYCAMTRPARYECYETFATDGDTEITPSQYEAFVAQVLGVANTASQKEKCFVYVTISIHALREEGDDAPTNLGSTIINISIHALREEGDFFPV